MFHTALRMVATRADAEDITQEVFAKVFENLAQFKGDSTLGAWIKRITVNTTLNHIRKNGHIHFLAIEEQFDLAEEERTQWQSPIELNAIHEAIKRLPKGCRLVFSLYLLEGYQHQEIAEILDITESTSKSQYLRAKRLLQKDLKKKVAINL